MKIYVGKSLGKYFGKQAISFVLAGTLATGVGLSMKARIVDDIEKFDIATCDLDNGFYYDEDVKNNILRMNDRIVGVDFSKAKTYEKVREKNKLNINRN